MKSKTAINSAVIALAVMLTGVPARGWAQAKTGSVDKPANNLEAVHDKLKADKKAIVTKYMELTDAEAKSFWPVYEDYQKDLQKFHERLGAMLQKLCGGLPRQIAHRRQSQEVARRMDRPRTGRG